MKIKSLNSFTWSIADILRGNLKQSEYGKRVLKVIDATRHLLVFGEPDSGKIMGAILKAEQFDKTKAS